MKKVILFLSLLSLTFSSNSQELSDLYEKLSQSVVKIMFEEETLAPQTGQMMSSEGLGSGVLIAEEGLVLTAAHVVQTAESIRVQFIDGETIPAKVISNAEFADVALIKLAWKPQDQIVAELGDSDLVRIGDPIFLIGSPYGLDFSLSVGVISGRHKQKRFAHGQQYMEFFQTDASINQGNSGGPMFNMKGEIIGVASFILSQSGGFQGLGFAATSNVCKAVLIDEPTPWWGIDAQLVTGELAKALNVPQSTGLLVQKVTTLSPLGMMGVEGGNIPVTIGEEVIIIGGDIILAVNGIPLTSEANFLRITAYVKGLKKGDDVNIHILRDGRKQKLKGEI